MSVSELTLVPLKGGLTIPAGAIIAVLNLERAGHRLTLDEAHEHIDIEAARGVPIDPHDLAQLRRWKQTAILLLQYAPDAGHMHSDAAPTDARLAPERSAS